MRHILNKFYIVVIIAIVTCCCTTNTHSKRNLFEMQVDGEDKYICVVFAHQKDTVVYCGFASSLYNTIQPQMEEHKFYKRCAKSEKYPIYIDSMCLNLLQDKIIYLNNSHLNHDTLNIEERRKEVLNHLNSNKPLSEEILLGIYQCWLHNIIMTTDDEVGTDVWFSYSIEE